MKLRDNNLNTSVYWNETYDSEIEKGIERIALERFEKVAKLLPHNAQVLDVGCGTGDLIRYLEIKRPDCVYTGIDFSDIAIEHCKQLSPVGTFIVGDIRTLNVLTAEYDVVISFETIEHFEDIKTFVKTLCSLTKPDGDVIITCPFKNMVDSEEHLHSLNYVDIITLFDEDKTDIVEVSRYSENFKNLFCHIKIKE